MSKEKFDAKLDQVVGSAKELAGKLTDNKEIELEGTVEKVVGKAKEFAADAKEKVEGVVSDIKETLDKK